MEFHYPRKIEEAVELLGKPSSLAFSGGTSFIIKPRAEHLIDLTRLGLNYIKNNKTELIIGATTTVTELEESRALASLASGILHAASSTLADTQLRNVITVGGDVACRYLWANLPPVLMVLEAKLKIAGRKKRIIPIEQFFESKLQPGEFISEIIIPKNLNKGKETFVKFSRTKSDYSLITVAVYAERRGKIASTVRIAVSGITRPTRMRTIESELQGKEVTEKLLAKVVDSAVAQLQITKSYIFSEEYRREVLSALLKRALKKTLMGR